MIQVSSKIQRLFSYLIILVIISILFYIALSNKIHITGKVIIICFLVLAIIYQIFILNKLYDVFYDRAGQRFILRSILTNREIVVSEGDIVEIKTAGTIKNSGAYWLIFNLDGVNSMIMFNKSKTRNVDRFILPYMKGR